MPLVLMLKLYFRSKKLSAAVPSMVSTSLISVTGPGVSAGALPSRTSRAGRDAVMLPWLPFTLLKAAAAPRRGPWRYRRVNVRARLRELVADQKSPGAESAGRQSLEQTMPSILGSLIRHGCDPHVNL